ncbi:uncharacterized protein LOC111628996 [Centruroides sculpturatus]|uniref:uncharacterized protein LOC111628996 n=1 Tax=Centruroides sculpturatus TaxID=218467 RepID=UPI000C6EA1B4|nr:uncharacterized protein LOC111628996 [Centruroides sculpturatus]
MNNVIKYIMLSLSIILTFVCFVYGFLACYVAFSMENTFQDIRNVVDCDLSLQFKFKVLDFIKRFGKVALAINIGGCFDITKRFPFKLAKTLHSVFSGMLKLRDVSHQKRNCTNISFKNNSYLLLDNYN